MSVWVVPYQRALTKMCLKYVIVGLFIYTRQVTRAYAKRLSLQFLIVDFYTHTYKRIGYVIIPKPHFSSLEDINSRCRHFDLLLFSVLAQSDAAMTAVDRSCCCRSLAIDRP